MSDKYYNEEITSKISNVYTDILSDLGEDPNREGLLKTLNDISWARA
jgi:GTP cyclohydrolase I